MPVIAEKGAPSLLNFAAIQCIEGEEYAADLSPKRGFITAQPVERIGRQIGEPQETNREVGGGIDGELSDLGREPTPASGASGGP